MTKNLMKCCREMYPTLLAAVRQMCTYPSCRARKERADMMPPVRPNTSTNTTLFCDTLRNYSTAYLAS